MPDASISCGESFEIPITVSWLDLGKTGHSKESFATRVRLTWGELIHHLPLNAGESNNRLGLMRIFSNSIARSFKRRIEQSAVGRIVRLHGKIDGKIFDKILETLIAQQRLTPVSPPKYVKARRPYWKLTPK